jgi:hypothetical protein
VIYPIFCKKYEQKLIQQKQEEVDRLRRNSYENQSGSPKSETESTNDKTANNVINTMGQDVEFERAKQYRIGQVAGMTRL